MTTTSTSSCSCDAAAEQLTAAADHEQRLVLQIVLAINIALFLGEFGAGWWAGSAALQGDSLDSLGDAGVYALSLYVVGRSLRLRAKAAVVKGVIQGLFGLAVMIEVIRRAMMGGVPAAPVMAVAASIAFVANLACFVLLARFRDRDINLRSVWLCSRNDLINNLGVIVAAGLVAWLGQGWPDLLVGALVAALFLHTSFDVLRTALRQVRAPAEASVGCASGGR
ncbi:MAG: cation transporter [Steroidobacteraceae bacterium]|jgi:Co/Zn/Cd efflux system component|nr:cation transporter [Steroidobacteraceae bacterium]